MKLAIVLLSLLCSPCFGIYLHSHPNFDFDRLNCNYYLSSSPISLTTSAISKPAQNSPKSKNIKKIIQKQLVEQVKKPKKD